MINLGKVSVVFCPEFLIPVLSLFPEYSKVLLCFRFILCNIELYWAHIGCRIGGANPIGLYVVWDVRLRLSDILLKKKTICAVILHNHHVLLIRLLVRS